MATATRPRTRKAQNLLTAAGSNTKLGALIHAFSLPAIATCPGQTASCARICYALKGHFSSPHVQKLYLRNQKASRKRDFARAMAKEIRQNPVRIVRIHVSGDFYSAAYVRKWAAIVAACPHVRFFAYTRSWRVPAILTALRGLAVLPNVSLWFSEDPETGMSPQIPRIRTCFLVHEPEDENLVDPLRHDLVFRDGRHRRTSVYPGQLKRINQTLVCPHEQNPQRRTTALRENLRPPVPCSTCQICVKNEPSRSRGLTIVTLLEPVTLSSTPEPARANSSAAVLPLPFP